MIGLARSHSSSMQGKERLPSIVKRNRIFRHRRTAFRKRVNSFFLYMSGLSYRDIAYNISYVDVSYEALRKFIKRIKKCIIVIKPEKKHRDTVAVDETKIKVIDIQLFVWNAIDVRTKELLAYRVSRTRSIIDALILLRAMLLCGDNKPLVIDRGPWYLYALKRLGLEFKHVTFGKRNAIERFYRTLKKRTKLFCNNINAKRHGIKALESFIALFCFWYNFCMYHQSLGGEPANVSLCSALIYFYFGCLK